MKFELFFICIAFIRIERKLVSVLLMNIIYVQKLSKKLVEIFSSSSLKSFDVALYYNKLDERSLIKDWWHWSVNYGKKLFL